MYKNVKNRENRKVEYLMLKQKDLKRATLTEACIKPVKLLIKIIEIGDLVSLILLPYNIAQNQSFVQIEIGLIYKTAINLYFFKIKAYSCFIYLLYSIILYYLIIFYILYIILYILTVSIFL